MMEEKKWKLWDYDKAYGDVFYKRATGALEEMESSKALCQVLSGFYQKGMTVVDVGCGAGHYLRSLRTKLDEHILYTGIDATEYYIELAKKAFPDNAEFKVGNIFELPVEDESYDVVINNNVLHHLPPPPTKALEELIRISKKHIVIRTLFGESNYIIKDIRAGKEGQNKADFPERDLVTAEEQLPFFNYYNMYTEGYFRDAVHAIDPQLSIEIIQDDMWDTFDDSAIATQTATKVRGNMQVVGNLILDWRFIVLTKPTS